jgi:hypothetical protein
VTHHRLISADSSVPDLPRLLNYKIAESDMGRPIGTSVLTHGPQCADSGAASTSPLAGSH